MTRTGQRRAALTTLITLAALATGCSSERDTVSAPPVAGAGETVTPVAVTANAPDEPIRSVAMVGDSITLGSEPALRQSLGELSVDLMAIDAENGRRMTVEGSVGSGLDAVDDVSADGTPDLWVVALGTNDVGHYDGVDQYRSAIDDVAAAIPADVPLVWVGVYLEGHAERSAAFNETLRAALDDRGNATIVDWATTADDGDVLFDGIHPDDNGTTLFALLVTAGVSDWLT